jgi:hypothetical protein
MIYHETKALFPGATIHHQKIISARTVSLSDGRVRTLGLEFRQKIFQQSAKHCCGWLPLALHRLGAGLPITRVRPRT